MNIFDLQAEVISQYGRYVQSFLSVADPRLATFIQANLFGQHALWPDSLIQLNPAYPKAKTVEELVAEQHLHPTCAQIFRNDKGQTIHLYQHQAEAIGRALARKHFVVTSGTGSGKTMTYFIPIFDAVLRGNPNQGKVWAIIVYPTNALVNSQEEALRRLAQQYQTLTGTEMPVRFAKYTGQESDEEKLQYQQHPPHILLTNYVMLELMLVRPQEHAFVDRTATGLQFLIVDELHSYRGRQGADVALLIRRLRERSGNPNLLCIGTSATMASGASRLERREAVAGFASKFFGVQVQPENIVEETLRQIIERPVDPTMEDLRVALQQPLPDTTWPAFSASPLSAWIEGAFGLQREDDGHLRRRQPISLNEGAQRLAELTGADQATCAKSLQQMLLRGSEVRTPDGDAAFAFRLHQFVSQGGSVYATLEAPDKRFITMQGQFYAPREQETLLYPLLFCRVCGQEYYAVEWREEEHVLLPDIGEPPSELPEEEPTNRTYGYLMIDPEGLWSPEGSDPPDAWVDKDGRIRKEYRPHMPRLLFVHPDGRVVDGPTSGAIRAWFLQRPFMLCLSCGEAYTRRDRNDFRKLTRLSSEGRSTATTLLGISAVEAMRKTDLDPSARKVLSFTDNRQDASLQAGHLNDFVRVAMVRSALYRSLMVHGELRFDNLARHVVEALALPLGEYARQANLEPGSRQGEAAANTFREVIEYLLYNDLLRGWRVVQPNLEQCGLLRVEYNGLDDLVRRDDVWAPIPLLAELSPERRETILRTLLDEMRRQLAIQVECLDRKYQEELCRRSAEYVNDPWGLDEAKELGYARSFFLPGADKQPGDISLSRQGVIGRWLCAYLGKECGHRPAADEYDAAIKGIVAALLRFGLLVGTGKGKAVDTLVRLLPSALVWRPGDGAPSGTPLRRYQATGDVYRPVQPQANPFFVEFYRDAWQRLRGMEGREHTAQVAYERRRDREEHFRAGTLPLLFCSPTMELGVDIRDLNVVHLRNVPPTPANYAQRSGRAGRAGQPALILAYCSYGSGHDQYYFQNRDRMVAGAVVLPRLDLGNEDLLRVHIHAIWLSYTRLALGHSIPEILDTGQADLPLKPQIRDQMALSADKLSECEQACTNVLAACGVDLDSADWFREGWLEEVLDQAPARFERSFDRWRELFRQTKEQFRLAQQTKDEVLFASGKKDDALKRADVLEQEARRQIDLLYCRGTKPAESDFYPYRYLASEGFLPGYNFPALPVRAYLPYGQEGEYLARPRFLAISEFAPGNTLYHEGARYRSERVWLPRQEPEKRFSRAKLCLVCGYTHAGDAAYVDLCENCNTPLHGGNSVILNALLEMPTVGTHRRRRITCDEEERLRFGYNITTHFRFAPVSGGQLRRRRAQAIATGRQVIAELVYGPAAELWRINNGWRNAQEDGFRLDLASGEWLGQEQEPTPRPSFAGTAAVATGVRPFVRGTANALLFYLSPNTPAVAAASTRKDCDLLATLQYALTRGIQEYFEVEEGELAVERIGKGSQRGILFWEEAEGGLGVLRRLVEEPDALAGVAQAALEILHFTSTGEDLRPVESDMACARACYDCLLSYYNQRDHRLLDRHAVRDLLLEIVSTVTRAGSGIRNYEEHYLYLRALTDTRSDLERRFLDQLHATGRQLPDYAQHRLPDYHCIPDFFYEPNACVFCDGSVHDEPQQRARDQEIRSQLEKKGYRVIVIRYDDDLEEQIHKYGDLFKEAGQ